ncbi:hypothetical protein Era103g07 [Erwinia phage Era103]|uniref:Uncharacterized protein n=1 Tax=Erwinia phage Era103 TaxID=418443 RepID=A2I7X5_9CAUD|nr:hypothetical protein Era103g07 [Erwinia phage Era103]ABM63397.1 hypothetical protein Era103g07 [Erwinia phage Era103]
MTANTTATNTATNTNVITFAENGEVSVIAFREEIALEIRAHLDNIGTAYLSVGKALNEAREDFDKQQDFLDWVASEFGIQKAQTYKLMKVGKVFGTDERFAGVAMRVLSVLAAHVDDAAVMERAADAAAKGDLDSQALTKILAPAKINMVPTNKPTQADEKPAPENSATPTASTPEQAVKVDAPHDVVIEGELVEATPEASPAAQASIVSTANNEREKGLLAMIETLKGTIEQMQQEYRRRDTERDSKVKAAPMLPQFKSKCLYARLGLSLEEAQDAKKVKKAQRELVKLGYGDSHAAWEAIQEAVTALTVTE